MPQFTNSEPFEVISAPYTLYVAPVGTAFPSVSVEDDDASFDEWTKVGSSGPLNYDRGVGVTVEHPRSITKWRSVGDAGSRKAFITEEDLMVKLKLVDLTLEQYANALNYNEVTSDAGRRTIGLSHGFAIVTRALLIRGPSPYGDQLNMQYEIPRAQQEGSPSVTLATPGTPAGLDLTWSAMVDTDATDPSQYFGRLVAEDGTT
jgi:hypothetical protein